jgi:large subunit ribosomal protein L21
MYAVIETGGKQYRVELGSEIEIDRLDAAPGEDISIGRVLLVADGDTAQVGQPVVDGATVSASVVRQSRGAKVVVFKYRPKARHRAKHGHRQELTVVRISDISLGGRSAAGEAERDSRATSKARAAAEKEAAVKAAADQQLAAKLAQAEKAKATTEEPVAPTKKTAARSTRAAASATTAKPRTRQASADKQAADAEASPQKPARARRAAPKKDE